VAWLSAGSGGARLSLALVSGHRKTVPAQQAGWRSARHSWMPRWLLAA
jgi:hypothetical protein